MILKNRFFLLLAVLLSAASAKAQDDFEFNVLPGFNATGLQAPKYAISASFTGDEDTRKGSISIKVSLGLGWHIYSTTQKPGGPMKTSFSFSTPGIKVTGPFVADQKPNEKTDDIFPGVVQEEHSDEVTWTAPIAFEASIKSLKDLVIQGDVKGQVCHDQHGCVPLSFDDSSFQARWISKVDSKDTEPESESSVESDETEVSQAGSFVPSLDAILSLAPTELTTEPFRSGRIHTTIEGQAEPSIVQPGGTVKVTITFKPDPQWYVYGRQDVDQEVGSKPTLISIVSPRWRLSEFQSSMDPKVKQTGLPSEPIQFYHLDPVSFSTELNVPQDAKPGSYTIRGYAGYMTCNLQEFCDPPTAAEFLAEIEVGDTESGSVPLGFAASSYHQVAKIAKKIHENKTMTPPKAGVANSDHPEPRNTSKKSTTSGAAFDLSKINLNRDVGETSEKSSLGFILGIAMLGGFILNFMPCVLPVIGLKVMAFVQQSGEDRRRTFLLNVWYAIGLLSIFWVLATFASAASWGALLGFENAESLGWGEQFNYDGFTIPILALVFVMALSFLGVWEIPIPGFASSGKAADLAEKEGYSGAFFKGVITTILATPCSGPGFATAFAYCAGKPPWIVYLIFTFVGLGMALPYLVIGAFPRLVRFIPKPGPWMDTFKQAMGFILLGAVAFLFQSVSKDNIVSTISLLFALWAGCWWIGRVPIGETFTKKIRAWAIATIMVVGIGLFVFQKTKQWDDFSLAKLEKLSKSQTVLVDFTADW